LQSAAALSRRVLRLGKAVTEVEPAGPFWEAEPEHQDFLERYPNGYNVPLPAARLDSPSPGASSRRLTGSEPTVGLEAAPRHRAAFVTRSTFVPIKKRVDERGGHRSVAYG
jgi:Peptide methionine sulfoxide reductase